MSREDFLNTLYDKYYSGPSYANNSYFEGLRMSCKPEIQRALPESQQVIFGLVYPLIFMTAVAGNILVLFVVLSNREMQSVTNVFIANLAASDLLVNFTCLWLTPLYIHLNQWIWGTIMCYGLPLFQGIATFNSTLTLMAIAIDRYIVIIHPFRPRISTAFSLAVILSIWMLSFLLVFPYAKHMIQVPLRGNAKSAFEMNRLDVFRWFAFTPYHQIKRIGGRSTMEEEQKNSDQRGPKKQKSEGGKTPKEEKQAFERRRHSLRPTSMIQVEKQIIPKNLPYAHRNLTLFCDDTGELCVERWGWKQMQAIYGVTSLILQFVIPFATSAFCYLMIWRRINNRHNSSMAQSSNTEAEVTRKRRLLKMLIAMVVAFVACFLPIQSLNIYRDMGFPFAARFVREHFLPIFLTVHAISMSATCWNPILFAWMNENFQREFKAVLPCFSGGHRLNRAFTIRTLSSNNYNRALSLPAALSSTATTNGRNRQNGNGIHQQNSNTTKSTTVFLSDADLPKQQQQHSSSTDTESPAGHPNRKTDSVSQYQISTNKQKTPTAPANMTEGMSNLDENSFYSLCQKDSNSDLIESNPVVLKSSSMNFYYTEVESGLRQNYLPISSSNNVNDGESSLLLHTFNHFINDSTAAAPAPLMEEDSDNSFDFIEENCCESSATIEEDLLKGIAATGGVLENHHQNHRSLGTVSEHGSDIFL